MSAETQFKLTYGTMFNPPQELHDKFDEAIVKMKANLGDAYGMIIDGKDIFTNDKFLDRSPINTDWVLGEFQRGSVREANLAVEAAARAFPTWSRTKWQERVRLLRKAADLLDERLYEVGAVMAMEVGKNRMESLGDVAETAELIRYSCDQVEANGGFIAAMGIDPLSGYHSTNMSVLKPYGVWLVISPFNFPGALTGGPAGAALAAGNTIVIKPATDTPFVPRLLAECFRDAGIPDGVVNFVTGPGSTLGQSLIENPDIAGITFTGSYDVGMGIYRSFANGTWVRPIILELGGKNPTIVSRHANLDDAAIGIMRSAFGLQGQKCSACSRVLIEEAVYEPLVERLVHLTEKIAIGDPTRQDVYLGPVINQSSYRDYQAFVDELKKSGKILTGGKIFTEGDFAKGFFCAPTLAADLPYEHRLWQYEMFLPITTVGKIKDLNHGMKLANSSIYGLTAGFYGTEDEAEWFFDRIEAGVNYVNRPQGATTGAWPGYQPFGGWKASGASGKNSGGLHYVQLYMHETIQNRVKRS